MKKLCSQCEFENLKDDLLRDMLVIGLADKRLQERLLREQNLTLDKVVSTCQTYEATRKEAKTMQQSSNKDRNYDIDAVRKFDKTKQKHYKYKERDSNIISKCKYCSYSHKRGECPAYGKVCNSCKKKNHFSACCTKKNKEIPPKKEINQVHVADDPSTSEDEFEEFFIGVINGDPKEDLISFVDDDLEITQSESSDEDWSIDLITNGSMVNYKIDTGARANVLPWKEYCKMAKKPKLRKSRKVKLTAYNGTDIPVKGSCVANVRVTQQRSSVPVLFIVADIDSSLIVELKTSKQLNLIKRICKIDMKHANLPAYLNAYNDCFGEIGCMKQTHHITTDPTVPPVVNPSRRIPISLQEKLHTEIQRMLKLGIIVAVDEPTDWVSNVVAVEKPDGTIRLCLDPKDLNKAVKRPHFVHPTTEEILARMTNARYFTKLDASSAYWQVPLDHENSLLLTFNTSFGRFRFIRMPYGLSSASDVCQKYILQVIDGIDGVHNSQDDIIIWGQTEEELETRTKQVLEACRKHGLKLNPKKCEFNQTELVFLGHRISSDGVRVDESKVEAIINMPYPKNVKDLQRFLGTVNYLAKFIPNHSERTASLRKLLEKNVIWHLDEHRKKDIDSLKKIITATPVLKFFDPNKPTKISSDASMHGLGAILEQEHEDGWHPVAYSSRSLKSYEQNYCQLEKEVLSIVFACERFHEYVYGIKFNVYNDHLPLKSIFKKALIKAPPRIQRFLLRLQKYDFEMHYIRGKLLTVADALSRASLADSKTEIHEKDMKFYIHSVMSKLLISDEKLKQFQTETEHDETLKELKKQIKEGWPAERSKVPLSIRPYYNCRQELTIMEDVIMKDNRIVVPTIMRSQIKKLLHSGHLGIVKTKGRARETLYWPGIMKEIENLTHSCEACTEFQNKQKKESLIQHDIPSVPWTKVGTDLFELHGKSYVIVVDYTTNYYDLSQIPDKKSETVVIHTKRIFSKFGIPKEVVSDNGPEFIGDAYVKFSKLWDFKHTKSSPVYPESNGQIERTIQTIKRSLKKAFKYNEDPYLALLSIKVCSGPYNNSPPATLFFKRPLRTNVPSMNTRFSLNNKKLKRNMSTNEKRRDLPNLKKDDEVRLHNSKSWSTKGKIVEVTENPRSYIVLNEKGNKVRRNRRDILLDKAGQPSRVKSTYESDDDDSYSLIEFVDMNDYTQELDAVIPDEDGSILELSNLMDELVLGDDDNDVIQPDIVIQPELPIIPNVTRSGRRVQLPERFSSYDMSA